MKSLRTILIAVMASVIVAGVVHWGAGGMNFGSRSGAAAPILYNQDTVTGIYDAASPAVVEIIVSNRGSSVFGQSGGQGSGFLVDSQGNILTNNHVVNGMSRVRVMLKSGDVVDAKVVGADPLDDLALVQVDAASVSGITPLQFADSSTVKPGQMAIALGSPYGLTNSITVGVVSGLNRTLHGSTSQRGMIQTDAAINPGNSGGPLLDSQGNVIGINTAIESAPDARGIGFAVSANTATRVIPTLMAGKQVTRPWVGISGMALTRSLAQDLNLNIERGVYVVSVVPKGPSEKAGLKAAGEGDENGPGKGGDVVTAVDGKAVAKVEDISDYINTRQVGDTVTLSLVRDGKSMDVQVTLETWPDRMPSSTPAQPHPTPPASPTPRTPRGQNSD